LRWALTAINIELVAELRERPLGRFSTE